MPALLTTLARALLAAGLLLALAWDLHAASLVLAAVMGLGAAALAAVARANPSRATAGLRVEWLKGSAGLAFRVARDAARLWSLLPRLRSNDALGRWHDVPAGDPVRHGAAGRAVAVLLGSVAPSRITVGVDAKRRRLLVHDLPDEEA